MTEVPPNTLRSLFTGAMFLVCLFLLAYLAAAVYAGFSVRVQDPIRSEMAASLLGSFNKVAEAAWTFSRPLLQLLIVLIIVEWILRRVGIQLNTSVQSFKWNVQAIIAIIVIAAYAVSELGGIGSGGLKDIALVVVGFYFGTQRHAYEVDPSTGKLSVIDEHENSITGGIHPNPNPPEPTAKAEDSASI